MLGHSLPTMDSTTHTHLDNTAIEQCRSPAVLPPEAVANLEASPSIIPRRTSFVKMATAKFKQHFHAPHGHKLFRTNSSNLVNEKPVDEEQKQKEKDFIACFECNGPPLSPNQIAEAPRSKEVGAASKQLRVGDFELLKTIGTGESAISLANSYASKFFMLTLTF